MENNVYKVYEDEIQLLEEEIKLLAEKYDDLKQESTFYSDEEILTSIKLFQKEFQGESKGECPSDLKAQLESLEREMSFLMKFTGIHFTSHSKKTLEKNENRTVQKHRLSGNCHSLPFQLEFQLLETQEGVVLENMKNLKEMEMTRKAVDKPLINKSSFIHNKENVSAVITDFNIRMESEEYSDLSKFVSSTEKHGNLLLFFRSLSSYAEWYEHRRCTFLHFKAKYPDIVALPEGQLGDYMILRNPKLPGFELMIVWKIHIDEEGRTTPVLDLLTKVPEQVLERKMAPFENAPTCFRSMLLLFGIETAIENLIKVAGLEKSIPALLTRGSNFKSSFN